MKIALVTTQWERFCGDPVIPWLTELVKQLTKKDVQFVVFTASYKGMRSSVIGGIYVYRFRYFPKRFETFSHEGAIVEKLKQSKWHYLSALSFIICGSISAFIFALKNNYDIVHIQWPFPLGIFGEIMRRTRKVPIVYTFHSAEFLLLKNALFKLILKILIKPVKMITCNSRYTQMLLLHKLGVERMKTCIIPFGSGLSSVMLSTTHSFKNTRRGLLFVGRLVQRKGVQFLIEALRIIVYEKKRDYVVDVVGDGPELSSLELKVKNSKLGKHVNFRGKVSNDILKSCYSNARLFVLPAIIDSQRETEGLGVVLVEAISFGVPVVASGVGGISDVIIDNKTGLLVPEKDPKALADAIVRLYEDDELSRRLVEEGQKHIQDNFSWDVIADKFTNVYSAVYSERN
jgi:glycosyltransferase involved in cell wall biosynthesis